MNAALYAQSRPVWLCQDDSSGTPNLYIRNTTFTYSVFQQTMLYVDGNTIILLALQ